VSAAAAADLRHKEAEEESPASEDEDDEEVEVEVVERIPKKAKLKDDKADQEEDSDDDSLAGAGDKSLSLVKHVSRSTPPMVGYRAPGTTGSAGFALACTLDDALWFPPKDGATGGGALAAHFLTMRNSIKSGDKIMKNNFLQNSNNQITKTLSPLYGWQGITSPHFNLLITNPTLPVLVILPPLNKFNGFAVFAGWIYDAYEKDACMPADAQNFKKVGYLKVVKKEPHGRQATQENSIEETATQETATQLGTQLDSIEDEEYEVCEGIKHFAVVVNQDWVARLVKNEEDKKFADRQRVATHGGGGGGGGHRDQWGNQGNR
jgi:hypothetical protein